MKEGMVGVGDDGMQAYWGLLEDALLSSEGSVFLNDLMALPKIPMLGPNVLDM